MTQTDQRAGNAPADTTKASPAGRSAQRRSVRSRSWIYPLMSLTVLVCILTFVEVASRLGWVSPLMVPAPSSVASALVSGFESGVYWTHLWSTLSATLLGFLLATVAGLTLGGLLAALPALERVMYPFIVAIQSTPKIAIAPLVIIWVGFGDLSKILIIAIVCFFPILVNTLQGLRLRERERQELVVALGANRWQVFRYVRLPGAMPYVFAGLHVGSIFALLGAVVAEFVGSRSGLGVLLNQERALFNVPAVFAILFILMIVGLTLNRLMKKLEQRVTFWSREDDQSTAASA